MALPRSCRRAYRESKLHATETGRGLFDQGPGQLEGDRLAGGAEFLDGEIEAGGERVDDADGLDLAWLAGAAVVGVTAGASAPEVLVQGVIDRLAQAFDVTVEEADAARETVTFKLPRAVA